MVRSDGLMGAEYYTNNHTILINFNYDINGVQLSKQA